MTLIGALLALPCSMLGAADGQAAASSGIPVDDRASWTIGFAALDAVEVEPANLYLSYSIPLVVREKLIGIRDHRYSEAERESYRRYLVDREIRSVSATLMATRRERDALAASGPPAQGLQAKEEKIAELAERIRSLEDLDLGQVAVADSKPVSFGSGGEDAGKLLDGPRYSPLDRARSADVDALVFGSIEEVEGYFFLNVRAITYPGGQVVLDYQDAFGPSGMYASAEELAKRLAGVVLGRPWGALRLTVSPADAEIRVDGQFVGVGGAELQYAETGERSVVAALPGYRETAGTVTVREGEAASLDIALEPAEASFISIESTPLLADVYVDSAWVGRTPIDVRRPVGLERVEIRREGREDRAYHVSPESAAEIRTVLPPRIFDPDQRQKEARNAFYFATGVWLVSLPLPIYFVALTLDLVTGYLAAVADGDADDQLRLLVRYRRAYSAYIGGLFVNLSLLTNVFINLVRYIEAGDRPAG